MLVAPLVFRAPRVLSCGPGCFVCPWAAARPLAVREIATREPAAPTDLRLPRGLPARFGRPRRELRSARRLVVRPGPTAHGHRSLALRALRRPSYLWGLLC